MSKVLVTGMSGTGKSASVEVLRSRGFAAVDTDTDDWSVWVTQPDGSPDWIWNEAALSTLLDEYEHGQLFVAGCKTNQGKFYSRFDHVVLLCAPAEILLARIANRTNNPYGKRDDERDEILRYIDEVEPRLRATSTLEIDASVPLDDVVDQLGQLA
jgi:dephospho-CoA kinase